MEDYIDTPFQITSKLFFQQCQEAKGVSTKFNAFLTS